MGSEPQPSPLAPLGREEYIEQAHFFHALGERLEANVPAQEVLASVREEVLATTKLPLAIDFLLGELRHEGVLGPAMSRLPHYFTPFQAFIVQESENERLRFDLRVGLEILRREAEYRATEPTHQGLFLYQFEVLCRNRLGYDRGLEAVASDPAFAGRWRDWIRKLRRQIGMVDIADVIYVHSEYYWQRAGKPGAATPRLADPGEFANADERVGSSPSPASGDDAIILFGEREGRIALANRKKDPLYLFSSLHRQLGYPEVPRVKPADAEQVLLPQLARRLEQLELRLKIIEEEQRGGLDLSKFYEPPPGM
ncbi:MAG TPA: hypothetical protein VHU84_06580 [Lacipirellulaceae bacterium]|jgi:hypothetical protein|nr:hypothetical protein [Lacipirellulaceae bacterium]